jgi:siroheme synthase
LPAAARAAQASAPAVIVIGEVVAHRARMLSLASAASEGALA